MCNSYTVCSLCIICALLCLALTANIILSDNKDLLFTIIMVTRIYFRPKLLQVLYITVAIVLYQILMKY